MYNKVFLIGNLVRDPEMRFTTGGIPITRFTIAVNRGYKSDTADFIRVITWRKLAEFCGEYLTKGRTVAVEGRLQIDEYEKNGKKRTSAEVQADGVELLSGRRDEGSAAAVQGSPASSDTSAGPADEDIPF